MANDGMTAMASRDAMVTCLAIILVISVCAFIGLAVKLFVIDRRHGSSMSVSKGKHNPAFENNI